MNVQKASSKFESLFVRNVLRLFEALGPYAKYRKGKNAVQARKKLTDVYGEGVLTVRQCQNWFAKFRSGNFDVEDAPRSGRPVEADKDAIKALVDANRRITTRVIGLRLNLSNSTVYDHVKGPGLSSVRPQLTSGHGRELVQALSNPNTIEDIQCRGADAR
ncbi:histone-lysine N-methyltransferase SETMAR [Trichonephila clavipes]|uniref:Histone-lysine N-methyltransferase SETMAR n=1 Tax=Trichonephila clavipes TaxID=2585209 RepID=A0A8X6SQ66_TRICX|nr:histone-lysine N-methyltransferase SETMAR [Trichonephila clavipes]